jgi:hypothetical protein
MTDQPSWAGGGSTGVAASGQEVIIPFGGSASNIRFSTLAQSSADYFGGELQSDGTQSDEVTFQKYLQSGTYTLALAYKTGPTHGIFTIFIDGVQLGSTIDSWVSAGGVSQWSTISGVVIPTSDVHAIRLLMATKNASATSFFGIIHGIIMTRTGP